MKAVRAIQENLGLGTFDIQFEHVNSVMQVTPEANCTDVHVALAVNSFCGQQASGVAALGPEGHLTLARPHSSVDELDPVELPFMAVLDQHIKQRGVGFECHDLSLGEGLLPVEDCDAYIRTAVENGWTLPPRRESVKLPTEDFVE